MRIIAFEPGQGNDITQYGSKGFTFSPLTRAGEGGVAIVHLAAGGEIGRHPATVGQLLVIVSGRGRVSGHDGVWQPIEAGQAVLWSAGEEHTTQAEETIIAVVVDLDQVAARP